MIKKKDLYHVFIFWIKKGRISNDKMKYLIPLIVFSKSIACPAGKQRLSEKPILPTHQYTTPFWPITVKIPSKSFL